MSSPIADEAAGPAKQGQLDALAFSGWGVPFRFVQPRNLCFWLVVLGVVGGAVSMIGFFRPSASIYQAAIGTGVAVFAIYTIPWWLYLTHLNRYATVPLRAIGVGFAWGFFAATFWIALKVNTAVLTVYAKAFGQRWAADWGAALTAPFTEETAKALGLVLLIGLAPRVVRTPFDGFILGAFIGLGFQISEDILYAFEGAGAQFGTHQIELVGQTFALRGLAGLFSHTMYSAIYGAGLMWLLDLDRSRHRVRGLLLIVAATFFHFTWDSGGAYLNHVFSGGGAAVANYAITIVLSLIVIRWLLHKVNDNERAWARAVLAPEVESGLLKSGEVAVLGARRKERRRYLHAINGHRNRRTVKHVLDAAGELAREIAYARGQHTAGVEHARAEISRVRSR